MKTQLLTILMLTGSCSLFAAGLTPEQALSRAMDSSTKPVKIKGLSNPELAYTQQTDGKATLYIFNKGTDNGILVLSADDSTEPILGYSDRGTVASNGDNIPDGMKYWLKSLGEQVAYNSEKGLRYSPRKSSTTPLNSISPMIASRWNQDAPYNDMCPEIGTTRCYTGCVATAMAQVMNYYHWPEKGTGSHSYTWNYTDESGASASKTLSLDYSTITYDWDQMLDIYDSSSSEDAQEAVATLMYSCGVSVDMIYGTQESGAVSFNMIRAFIENFGYDKGVRYLMRDYYGIDEWEQIIYDNLVNYGPVLYGGMSNDGGHQFVCDGYDGGYFHFNWGWGGLSDGYFVLTALDPGAQGIGGSTSGYNFSQDIVTHLTSAGTSTSYFEQVVWDGDFTINQDSVELGSEITFTGNFFNYSYNTIKNTTIGIKLTPADGGAPTYLASQNIEGLGPERGWHVTWPIKIPDTLAAGTYTVQPAILDSNGEVQDVRVPIVNRGSYILTVADGTGTFKAENPATIKAENLELDSDVYIGTSFKTNATITNVSDTDEFYGTVFVGIERNDTVYAQGGSMQIDLQPGESLDWEYVSKLVKRSTVSTLDPGAYQLYLYRINGGTDEKLAGPIDITLHAASTPTLTMTDLSIANNQRLTEMRAHGTLECESGYFAGSLSLIIFPGTGGTEIASYQSEFIAVGGDDTQQSKPGMMKAEETTPIDFSFNFTVGEDGQEYIAAVYNSSKMISNYVRFKTGVTTGIDSTENDNEVIATEYFTTTGISLGNQKPGTGIYVMRNSYSNGDVKSSVVKL